MAESTIYDPSQRGPRSHLEAMHPDDRARVERGIAELVKHPGQVVRTEWRHQHKDGGYRWHEGVVANRLGEEGIDGIVVNIRDITERMRAEEAVLRNEQRFRSLFATVTDGVFLLSREGRIIEVNDAACRMLGCVREELPTKCLADIAPEGERERAAEVSDLVAQKGRLVFEGAHRRKDGSTYPVEVAASRVELDGKPYTTAVLARRVRVILDRG